MCENLTKAPRKSILKQSSSFDSRSPPSNNSQAQAVEEKEERKEVNSTKNATFDETNILATYHPPDKDYGHMHVEEPKTPFQYVAEEEEESEKPRSNSISSCEELRQQLKNEFQAVRLARRLMEEEEEG